MPLTPLGASVYLPAVVQAFGPVIEKFGLLVEGAEMRSRERASVKPRLGSPPVGSP